MHILIVGGGVFGLSAAVELRLRGHVVTVFDRCELPAWDGSSNDISRIVRMDYGADDFFTSLAHESIHRWRQWNNESVSEKHGKLFHEVGVVLLAKVPLSGYEADSMAAVQRQGLAPQRLSAAQGNAVWDKFPGWSKSREYIDGYLNKTAGWADAGETVAFLARKAARMGVTVRTGAQGELAKLLTVGKKTVGIQTKDGKEHKGDFVLVSSGAWSPSIIPELTGLITAVGHPVIYVKVPPTLKQKFTSGEGFPVFTADISRTGYYGFPLAPNGDLLKVGNHGNGFVVKKTLADGRVVSVPDATAPIPQSEQDKLKKQVVTMFPDLQDAETTRVKLCWYCESWDSYFYIDHVPGREGLGVACGSTGHGFKFTPVLGEIIADAVEKKPNKAGEKFKWRLPKGEKVSEACRFGDGEPTIIQHEQSKL